MNGGKQGGTRPLRVIEWSGPTNGLAVPYAGWLLARLGAEVVHVVCENVHHPSLSESPLQLAREAFTERKKAVNPPRNRAGLDTLLLGADVLLCETEAVLASLGSDAESLRSSFPELIIGFASSFGREAANGQFTPLEIDAQALSASAWSLGESAREPLTLPAGVVEHQSGVMLAAGCLLALISRDGSKKGGVVDIALAEVLASHVAGNCRVYIHHGLKWHRNGRRPYGSCGAYPFAILPCKDGDICISGRTRAEWERFIKVMGNPAWASEPRYQDLRAMGTRYPEEGDALLAPWLMQHTRDELESLALENNLILSPLRRLDEVLTTPQFHHRGFIDAVSIRDRSFRWPGLPFRVSAERKERAPDFAASMLSDASPVPDEGKHSRSKTDLPLAGLRVIDFGWVWSAPWVGTMLSEMGAEVIKVEHASRPDNVRLAGKVIRDGQVLEGPTREMSPMFHQINHGKLGITLNLKDPRGVDLARRLIATSDLVIENMSPGSMERSGLGFEDLRAINPRLVMLAMSAAGQFGPASSLRAYAPTMSAFAGLESLVGYRDEPAIGALNFALGDPNASLHGLFAALAAIRRARQSGLGAYIDLSQVEALVSTVRPYLLAAQYRGEQPAPAGNSHPEMSPHGIYPARGEDRWLSIAVCTDQQWQSLVALASDEGVAFDPRYSDLVGRLAFARELDKAIAVWTRRCERDELVDRLRSKGVAASPVKPIEEMWRDPLLSARSASAYVEIPFYGPERVFRGPWRLSAVTPRIDRPGPRLGEHNTDVFSNILKLEQDEIERLVEAGVIA